MPEGNDRYQGILVIGVALNVLLCFSTVSADNEWQQMSIAFIINPFINFGCLIATLFTYLKNRDNRDSQAEPRTKVAAWLLPIGCMILIPLLTVIFPQ